MGSPALAGALVAAVVLAGAGLWAGISISREEKYEDEAGGAGACAFSSHDHARISSDTEICQRAPLPEAPKKA